MTRLLFVGLLVSAAGWGLIRAWRARRESERTDRQPGALRDPVGIAIQTPLFFLAVWFGWEGGALSRVLFSPAPWLLGLALGHAVFAVSLLITHGDLRDAGGVLFGPGPAMRFAIDRFDLTLKTLAIAFTEELIFREAAQHAVLMPLMGTIPGILLAAACFVAVHEHLFRNTPRGLAEFAGFALLLGVLYHATDSLALVTAVHAARNLESSWLEAECGDPGLPEGAEAGRAEPSADVAHGTG